VAGVIASAARPGASWDDRSVTTSSPPAPRFALFALLVGACLAVALGYIAWAGIRQSGLGGVEPDGGIGGDGTSVQWTERGDVGPRPHLVFQSIIRHPGFSEPRLAEVSLANVAGPRLATNLSCSRVYMAAGRGLCLLTEGVLITRQEAILFDDQFEEQARIELNGPPSRARISADGRYGAVTVFVFGHSYAEANFSTETTIIDMASATTIGSLEQFAMVIEGQQAAPIDANLWGVTFTADSNVFYATLATGGETYLVQGDIAGRRLQTIRRNVECPSLSPDGTRIAFKKRVGEPGDWRFSVLELDTMEEIALSETQSVDDQIEWLDDDRLVYGKDGDLWTIRSDGSGSPELFLRDAVSPAIVR
jgi:hypothetical protein